MKKTGEFLKKTREEKGLSIHEIGLSLKINSKILKAIEEGDAKNLPAKTFLRGFVQSYAQYLKLNPTEVLKIFSDEMGSTRPEIQLDPDETTSRSDSKTEKVQEPKTTTHTDTTAFSSAKMDQARAQRKEKFSPADTKYKNGMVMGVVALLLGGILLTKKIIDRYQNEAEVPASTQEMVKEPLDNADSTSPDATSNSAGQNAIGPIHGPEQNPALTTATAGGVAKTNSSPAPAPSVSSTAPVTTTPSTLATAQNPAAPKVVKTPEVKVNPPAAPAVAPVSAAPAVAPVSAATAVTTAPVVAKEKNVELIFEAMDNVEIELQTSQGKTEKIKLVAEQIHRFKTRAGLKVSISNGGAVNIIVNGKDAGVPGVLGQPVKLTY
jgi:cytoskeleton protein RodZ